ncbi:hypothetical protein D3C87_2117700 [compost metagenome]
MPVCVLISSSTTSAVQHSDTEMRRPTKNPGSAPGNATLRTNSLRDRPSVCASSTWRTSMPRSAAWVLM